MNRDLIAEITQRTGLKKEGIKVTLSRIKKRYDLKSIQQAACLYIKRRKLDINVSSIVDDITRQVLRDQTKNAAQAVAGPVRSSQKAKSVSALAPKVKNVPSADYGTAARLADFYPYLFIFENALRIAVESKMAKAYGGAWWESKLKNDLPDLYRYAADEKKKQSKLPIVGRVLNLNNLECLTIGHLDQLIQKYGALFVPSVFPTIHFFSGHMVIVKYVRNALAHVSPGVTARDIKNAKNELDILLQHLASL